MSENSRRTLYMIAGLYLIYSGGNLTMSVIKGKADNTTIMLIAGIAFLFVGIFFVVDYIRYRKKSFSQQNTEAEKEVQTIEAEDKDSEKEGE